MTCPARGKRIHRLILWSLILFFVSVFCVVKPASPLPKPAARDDDRPVVQRAIALTDRGEVVRAAHPDRDNVDCNLVAGKKVRLHMGKPKVLEAWGPPARVITVHDEVAFRKETWIMNGDRKVTFNLIGLVESFEEPGPAAAISHWIPARYVFFSPRLLFL